MLFYVFVMIVGVTPMPRYIYSCLNHVWDQVSGTMTLFKVDDLPFPSEEDCGFLCSGIPTTG